MLALFVSITILENLETFNATVYAFYEYSVFRQIAVELFLQLDKRMLFRCLERCQTERVEFADTLITFVRNQQDVR